MATREDTNAGHPAEGLTHNCWRIAFESIASMVHQTLVSIWSPSPSRVCRTRERLSLYGAHPWLFYGFILNIEPDLPHRAALHFQSPTMSMASTYSASLTVFWSSGTPDSHNDTAVFPGILSNIDKHLSLHIQLVSSTDHMYFHSNDIRWSGLNTWFNLFQIQLILTTLYRQKVCLLSTEYTNIWAV